MHIHEYQAKELFREYHIPVLPGRMTENPGELPAIMDELGLSQVVIKAQIHAGGRGKAGGVLMASGQEAAEKTAASLLGKTLYTKQTGDKGKIVRKLYIEPQTKITDEYYLSLLIDPSLGMPTFVASSAGGMDIEDAARSHPEKVFSLPIDPAAGYKAYHGYQLADDLMLPAGVKKEFVRMTAAMYRLFMERDASMIEINPLAVTGEGELLAIDAKVDLDESAFFRHPENALLRDRMEEEPLEALASDDKMNYVSLDGDIGCLVIGAGLGMSTMDAIQYFGGKPANFMDCGGSVTAEKARKAYEIVSAGESVKGILVNIFGGITRTNLIAQGIAEALSKRTGSIPLVVRLEGTGSDEGNVILSGCGYPLELASSLSEGCRRIIALTHSQQTQAENG